LFPRQVHEGGVSGCALDDGADRGPVRADDEITFVVPGDRTVVGFFGTLADEYVRCHMGPGNAFRSRAWHPKSAAGAQAQDEFAAQRTATLDEQGLVDGFVADPHGLIIREIDR